MGLVRAIADSIGGTLADQWKDFYSISPNLAATVALSAAHKNESNSDRGSNTNASENIISNGTKFIVPEGYGLILVQDGAFTGYLTEPLPVTVRLRVSSHGAPLFGLWCRL